jgi:TATA-box binding protein (TBP) (component of TFIID and TFIIIB)
MITVRFSEEQDKELLRRFLFRRPHLRWSSQNVPQCHNVVGNANYCIPFKPQEMMRQFPNIEYQLKNFPAVIVRIRPPRGATLLTFKSGRTVQMGMTSDISFTHSVQHFRMQLLQKNYLPSLKPLYFANRVYSFDVGFSLAIWQVEFRFVLIIHPQLTYLQ